jgi:isoquinoline 1-oxidoreductase beta subunit
MSRRAFVATGGAAAAGLIVAFRWPAVRRTLGLGEAAPPFEPNAWLSVAADGSVRIMVDEMEMGQGVMTAMPMIVAEELDVPWDAVSVEYGPANPAEWPRGISTGGSTSTRTGWDPLHTAGAQAREVLRSAAAQEWGVDPSECGTGDGRVTHEPTGQSRDYGDLVEVAATIPVPEEPPLKDPDDYRILGRRLPRIDTPEKVDGSKVFGMDIQVPGMAVACVERSPVLGGALRTFDGGEAQASPGVRAVVRVPSGVAVVADDTWSALEARKKLRAEWDPGVIGELSAEGLDRYLRQRVEERGAVARDDGEVEGALRRAVTRVEADYQVPYLAHATMEPMNCTVWVKDDGTVEVWAPTQNATNTQRAAAEVAGVPPEQVTVHAIPMGGGFGRRSQVDFVREAAEVSMAVGGPIKVVWSREDDTRGGYFRPASYQRFRAGLGADGMPVAWHHRVVAPSIFHQMRPGALDRANGVDGDAVGGAASLPYGIPNLKVEFTRAELDVPLWFWRAVGHSTNGFTTESFLDEVAVAAGADPAEYRHRLLSDHPRHLGVLERALEASNWGATLPQGVGRGVSVHESFGSFVAQVAEVSVEGGRPRVHRVVVAVDCGQNINPDTIEAQMDSCVAYGLSAALWGDVTFENGRVVQGNFDTYPAVRISDMPRVETHIVASRERPGGIGEAGLPPLASAVGNALYDLTGERIRRLPMAPEAATV